MMATKGVARGLKMLFRNFTKGKRRKKRFVSSKVHSFLAFEGCVNLEERINREKLGKSNQRAGDLAWPSLATWRNGTVTGRLWGTSCGVLL